MEIPVPGWRSPAPHRARPAIRPTAKTAPRKFQPAGRECESPWCAPRLDWAQVWAGRPPGHTPFLVASGGEALHDDRHTSGVPCSARLIPPRRRIRHLQGIAMRTAPGFAIAALLLLSGA